MIALYFDILSEYVVFRGRASRMQFWFFSLVSGAIGLALWYVDQFTGLYSESWNLGALSTVFGLATALPWAAVTVRRLHDAGRSGWWYFIDLVPVIGGFWMFGLLLLPSQPGTNKYGPDPHSPFAVAQQAPPADGGTLVSEGERSASS